MCIATLCKMHDVQMDTASTLSVTKLPTHKMHVTKMVTTSTLHPLRLFKDSYKRSESQDADKVDTVTIRRHVSYECANFCHSNPLPVLKPCLSFCNRTLIFWHLPATLWHQLLHWLVLLVPKIEESG